MDSLIEQLNGIYDKIQNTRYTKEELYKKREELSQLRIAIRDLQLKGKVNRLVDLGLLEYKKYSEMLENKTLTGKDTQEAIKILEVFGKSNVLLYDLRDQYYTVVKEKGNAKEMAAFKEVNDKFLQMTSKVSKLIDTIKSRVLTINFKEDIALNLKENEKNGFYYDIIKSNDELADLYKTAGVDFSKETIAYCRIGERSAFSWFVLHELLDLQNVTNYDGSWTEWGNLVGVPIATGEEPGVLVR